MSEGKKRPGRPRLSVEQKAYNKRKRELEKKSKEVFVKPEEPGKRKRGRPRGSTAKVMEEKRAQQARDEIVDKEMCKRMKWEQTMERARPNFAPKSYLTDRVNKEFGFGDDGVLVKLEPQVKSEVNDAELELDRLMPGLKSELEDQALDNLFEPESYVESSFSLPSLPSLTF